MDQDLITASEMAERLDVGEATVYRYIVKGRIPSRKVRWGLRYRYEVLRADFDRVAPGLMAFGAEGESEYNREDERAPMLATA